MAKEHISEYDLEQLAAELLEIETWDEPQEVYDPLYQKYSITQDDFANIITDLYMLLTIGYSHMSTNFYAGFAADGMWLLKKDVKNLFIGGIIEFMLDGEDLSPESNGYERIITDAENKPLFKLAITHPDREITIKKPTTDENK